MINNTLITFTAYKLFAKENNGVYVFSREEPYLITISADKIIYIEEYDYYNHKYFKVGIDIINDCGYCYIHEDVADKIIKCYSHYDLNTQEYQQTNG